MSPSAQRVDTAVETQRLNSPASFHVQPAVSLHAFSSLAFAHVGGAGAPPAAALAEGAALGGAGALGAGVLLVAGVLLEAGLGVVGWPPHPTAPSTKNETHRAAIVMEWA